MAHPIGTVVAFEFTAFRATTSEPYIRKSGKGVVIDDQNYSVWPCPGYSIRVTESPDYKAGEVVGVAPINVRKIGGAS